MKHVISVLVVVVAILSGCSTLSNTGSTNNQTIQSYAFNTLAWELKTIPGIFSYSGNTTPADAETIRQYFDQALEIKKLHQSIESIGSGITAENLTRVQVELDIIEQRNSLIAKSVELTLKSQLQQTVRQLGINNALNITSVDLPPVEFRFEEPPNVLIISPRDSISILRSQPLKQELTLAEKIDIESITDGTGVSSLVVGIGGYAGTYPAIISNESSLDSAIYLAAHEWAHAYLTLRPLGITYLLDVLNIRTDYDVYVMNETVATVVGNEVGNTIISSYYTADNPPKNNTLLLVDDFNLEEELMNIRTNVDKYLADGQIATAEDYMERKRLSLAAKGYFIRKLNQAYFAFHDGYPECSDSHCVSTSGLLPKIYYVNQTGSTGDLQSDVILLRENSNTLKEFLETIAVMTSADDLQKTLSEQARQQQ